MKLEFVCKRESSQTFFQLCLQMNFSIDETVPYGHEMFIENVLIGMLKAADLEKNIMCLRFRALL